MTLSTNRMRKFRVANITFKAKNIQLNFNPDTLLYAPSWTDLFIRRSESFTELIKGTLTSFSRVLPLNEYG
ncbi:hypothetical protein X777_11690 [Ooceraea biroi]|uniref:Uncharacterized protein n=1 Tax=Ooceraea biroi TaxID=2015173 RepID=A0A026W362_OOCBI|nr:hypothetical protein X777_11690 [Ooceraea biroi]